MVTSAAPATIRYAIKLPANRVLQERVAPLLTQPMGRPPDKPQAFFASSGYQAHSWSKPRRVVTFDNGRGTAEQWLKEGKHAIRWTRLASQASKHNAARLHLHALAYNLANFMRVLALPKEVEHWSLTTLREKLVKIGARIVRHGHVVCQLAEVTVPRALFKKTLRRIDRLRLQRPPVAARGRITE